MEHESRRWIRFVGPIVLFALGVVVVGGLGYVLGNEAGRKAANARAERRENRLADEMLEKNRTIVACRETVQRASKVIRAKTLYINNLYDDALEWMGESYRLGMEGNLQEATGGLGRFVYEQAQLEESSGLQLSANGWTGWADQEKLVACDPTYILG